MTSSPILTLTGMRNAALRLKIRSCRSVQVDPPTSTSTLVLHLWLRDSSSEHADLLASSHARTIHYLGQQHRASTPNACLAFSTHCPHTSQLNGSPLRSAPAPFPHRSRGETARWANGESSFYAHLFLSTFHLSDEAHLQGPPEMLVDHAFGMAQPNVTCKLVMRVEVTKAWCGVPM